MGRNENTNTLLLELYAKLAVNEGKRELIVQICFRFMVLKSAAEKMPGEEAKYLKAELSKCADAVNLTEFVAAMESAKKQYELIRLKFRYLNSEDLAALFPKKTKTVAVERDIDDPDQSGQTMTVKTKEKVQTTDQRELCQIMPDAMGLTGYSIIHYLFQTRTENVAIGGPTEMGLAKSARKIFHAEGGNKRIALLNYCVFFTYLDILAITSDPDGGERAPIMVSFTDTGFEWWLTVREIARNLYEPFARRCAEIQRSIEDIEAGRGARPLGGSLRGISAVILTSAAITVAAASSAKAEEIWTDSKQTFYDVVQLADTNSNDGTTWNELNSSVDIAALLKAMPEGPHFGTSAVIYTVPETKSYDFVNPVNFNPAISASGEESIEFAAGAIVATTAAFVGYSMTGTRSERSMANWASPKIEQSAASFANELYVTYSEAPLSDAGSRLGGTVPLIDFLAVAGDPAIGVNATTFASTTLLANVGIRGTNFDTPVYAELSGPTDRLGETIPLILAAFNPSDG